LTRGLEVFCESADKLASIAANFDLQDEHIIYCQDVVKMRVMELKKQLEHKAPKITIELPSSNNEESVNRASEGKSPSPSNFSSNNSISSFESNP
jgi:hypothetical protein